MPPRAICPIRFAASVPLRSVTWTSYDYLRIVPTSSSQPHRTVSSHSGLLTSSCLVRGLRFSRVRLEGQLIHDQSDVTLWNQGSHAVARTRINIHLAPRNAAWRHACNSPLCGPLYIDTQHSLNDSHTNAEQGLDGHLGTATPGDSAATACMRSSSTNTTVQASSRKTVTGSCVDRGKQIKKSTRASYSNKKSGVIFRD